jgi:hypothetical protein
MTIKHLATALVATLLWGIPASAQSAADLLQKGIYSQETLGDLDGAVQSYRQVLTSYPGNKQIAAQAQYQLVLCMLQKGDRPAAAHELDLLTRNFPDQQDYINKARKLIPGATTLLAAPWAEGEASQLNIKRDGVFTGEYLYYSATPWRNTVQDSYRDPAHDRRAIDNAQAIYLGWDLVTKSSTRTVVVKVNRDTLRRIPFNPPDPRQTMLYSDDPMGDVSAAPFAGPAIDTDMLVFRMRVLPLAVGYKTTLSTLPFLLGHGVSQPVELAVTGVEAVQAVAGKFNCYKVVFASLGQTFWIGVDGARPLVKFQSGNVEAELVKVWGPSVLDDAVAFLKTAGWAVENVEAEWHGPDGHASVHGPDGPFPQESVNISMRRIYTRPAEIDGALQRACEGRAKELSSVAKVRPQSTQTRKVGGHQSLSCIIENDHALLFDIWIGTESLMMRFSTNNVGPGEIAVWRWMFEPVLDTIKLPK